MTEKNKNEFLKFFPTPEQGNVFGWKFSIFSLVIILLMAGLTWYSHKMGNDPFKLDNQNTSIEVDSSKIETE